MWISKREYSSLVERAVRAEARADAAEGEKMRLVDSICSLSGAPPVSSESVERHERGQASWTRQNKLILGFLSDETVGSEEDAKKLEAEAGTIS